MNFVSDLSKSRLILDARTLVLAVTCQTSIASLGSGISRPSALAILRNGLYCDTAGKNGKNELGEHDHVSLCWSRFVKGDGDSTIGLLGTGDFLNSGFVVCDL